MDTQGTSSQTHTWMLYAFLVAGPLAAAALVYLAAMPTILVAACYAIVGIWTLGLAFFASLLVCPPLAEKVMTRWMKRTRIATTG